MALLPIDYHHPVTCPEVFTISDNQCMGVPSCFRSPASMGERGGWNLSYGGYGMRAGYGGYGMRRDADWLEARQCFCPRSQGARGAGYRVA